MFPHSRQLPAIFQNATTYGLDDTNFGKPPKILDTMQVTLPGILRPGLGMATILCAAGLQKATDAEDIAKLMIGALLEGSGVSLTSARITSPHRKDYEKPMKEWIISRLYDEAGNLQPDFRMEEPVSSRTNPIPSDCLPEWYNNLNVNERDILEVATSDSTELYAYAGVLALAISKTPTSWNLENFNSKHRGAIQQLIPNRELVIFTDGSKYLDLETLTKANRVFNLHHLERVLVVGAIVDNDTTLVKGLNRTFYTLFRLSSGSSLNSFLIIMRFVKQYPEMRCEFPHLSVEYAAAALAIKRFLEVSPGRRFYLKVIFGSDYVPVPHQDISNLLKLAICALEFSEPSLINFGGDRVDAVTRAKVMRLLQIQAPAEEAVPEETT